MARLGRSNSALAGVAGSASAFAANPGFSPAPFASSIALFYGSRSFAQELSHDLKPYPPSPVHRMKLLGMRSVETSAGTNDTAGFVVQGYHGPEAPTARSNHRR